jgi:hypothetical protein
VSPEAEAGCVMSAMRLLLIIELRARFRELYAAACCARSKK